MNKLTMMSLLAGFATTGALAAGSVSFAASPPVTAGSVAASAGHPGARTPHHPLRRHSTITAVTSTTLTLTAHHHPVQTFAMNSITVHVGAYAGTPAMLATGQHVVVLGAKTSHPQIRVLPVAHGVLTAAGSGWTVVTPHATLTLANATPTLMGLSTFTAGTHVSVYGTRSGTTLTESVIAAVPTRQAGRVVSNLNGILTVKTKTNPTLTITEANVPGTKMLAKIKAGRRVLVLVNPATQAPLAVMPRPATHHKHVARKGRFAVGTFTADSSQSFSMADPLGTETVSLTGRTVKIIWPQHTGATLSQIPAGTPLTVHLAGKTHVIVHVS